jgi:hypothetical protein
VRRRSVAGRSACCLLSHWADNNLAFSFTKLNLRETLNHAKIDEIELAHMPSRSVNEKRMEKGLEPLPEEHFNWPMVITPTGAVSLRDVPTARELMESKNKGGESAPQEASA